MNGTWSKFWPKRIHNFEGFVDVISVIYKEIMDTARRVRFDELLFVDTVLLFCCF
jgi:hypothetical protein